MASVFTLQSGSKIPAIAYGTYGSQQEIVRLIEEAFDAGFRHFDAAAVYGNENFVGEGIAALIAKGKARREELFITSKLWNDQHRKEHVKPALEKTLKDLQLNYLDLYLVHWPFAVKNTGTAANFKTTELDFVSMSETWACMEKMQEEGLVKNIGVSNFNVQLIFDLLSYAKIKPQVNQVELHPYNAQAGLIEFSKKYGILTSNYSPVGGQNLHGHGNRELTPTLENPVVKKIASKHNCSTAQVLLRWSTQQGLVPVTKSTKADRMKDAIESFKVNLSQEDMKEISSLDEMKRYNGDEYLPLPIFS